MSRGGYRPGSGPKKGTKYKKKSAEAGKQCESLENLDPLTYMLKVMNDEGADKERRDRMAIAAAPFVHPRKGEGKGKKDEKGYKAKQAGAGKFAAGKPPLRIVKFGNGNDPEKS